MKNLSETPPKKTSFWRQPLLHFTIIGALIFAWGFIKPQTPSPQSYKIDITASQIERLGGLWTKTWGRPPTNSELEGLIQDQIKEEIYYREAKHLGLDVNDAVIRRRLRQKMEFLSADTVKAVTPSEAELKDYYAANTDRYQSPARYNLRQIYYKPDQAERAKRGLQALQNGRPQEINGDPITLPRAMEDTTETEIARLFGSAFYEHVKTAQNGIWIGPVKSGLGLHLINVETLEASQTKDFQSVRNAVERDWRENAQRLAREQAFEPIRDQYNITITRPE